MLYTFNLHKLKKLPKSAAGRSFCISDDLDAFEKNRMKDNGISHWPELELTSDIFTDMKRAAGIDTVESFNKFDRPVYVSKLLYEPKHLNMLAEITAMLKSGDAAVCDRSLLYEISPRAVIADIILSYGYDVCELGNSPDDIKHYKQPVRGVSSPLVLPAGFISLNNTMQVDISFIPMISENIDDTEIGRNIQNMLFFKGYTSSVSKKNEAVKYRPDSRIVRNSIYNMISRYGWDVHANVNMPDDIRKHNDIPVGVLPVFNIDQLTHACHRLLTLADANKWDCVLMPYVNTRHLPWEIILRTYQSILDGRFIIADESQAEEPAAVQKPAAKIFPVCCAVGHKPMDMFDHNQYKARTWEYIDGKLNACIKQLITEHGTRKFISGGAQGVEQMFFSNVDSVSKEIGIHTENWMYEPFNGYQEKWPDNTLFGMSAYNNIRERAKRNKTFKLLNRGSELSLDKKTFAKALHVKNTKMVNESDVVIGVFKRDINEITDSMQLHNLSKSDTIRCTSSGTGNGTLSAALSATLSDTSSSAGSSTRSATAQTLRYAYNLGKAIIVIHPETLTATRLNF